MRAPDREFGDDESLSPALIEWLSWELAARLVGRHHGLRVIEDHPGGGQYDCLTIVGMDESQRSFRIDLNRVGSGHVHRGNDNVWSWRRMWNELAMRTDLDLGVALLEHFAALGRAQPNNEDPCTLAYCFIATALRDTHLGAPRRVAYAFDGSTWAGLPVPDWGATTDGRWVLYEAGQPMTSIAPRLGVVAFADGTTLDLMG